MNLPMKLHEFKDEYLKNAFYWIHESNYLEVQIVMMKCGVYPHTGDPYPIKWHKGFSNICTFEPDKHHKCRYYQKADMYIPNARYGEPKNAEAFLADYKTFNCALQLTDSNKNS